MITRQGADRARLRPWLVAGIALWIEIGIVLVDRAGRQGLVTDIEFSPYHLVGYAGLAVLAIYVAWSFFRAMRHRRWRQAFPEGYGGVGLGFACFVAWIVIDGIWRNTLGINGGVEGGLAPPRLLLPLGLVLVASGPLREGLEAARQGASTWIRTAAPAVLSVGVIGAAVTLVVFNPVRDPWNDLTTAGARDAAEIWSMAADGTDQTRVLAALETGIDFSLPAWSPDGKQIAYTRWKNSTEAAANARNEDQTSGIWVMSADGSNAHQVIDGAPDQAWIPAWSPDGAWLAYTISATGAGSSSSGAAPQPQPNLEPGQVGPPSGAPGAQLWLVHPDGSGARQLTTTRGNALAAVWSPDGHQIAYLSGLNGSTDVAIATITEGGLSDDRLLAADAANDWAPAWSPDGKGLAFTSNRTGNDEIWVIGTDGSGLTRLTENTGGDWVPAWSPDGARIAFVSDRNGDIEVWSMAADGADVRDLSNSPASDDGRWSVAWSPDGSRIAYARTAYPDAVASGFVREDFAAAITILWGIALAVIALLLVAVGGSGGFTVVLTLVVAIAALASDQWRFLPASVVAGIVVDILIRWAPPRLRSRVAATALPALAVLGIGLTLSLAGTTAWSVTLLLGAIMAVGLIGWGLGELVRRLAPAPA